MISANGTAKNTEISEMAEKDQVPAERKDIHMGSSVQESVGETGNGEDKASDHENDVVSQELVMEQSFKTHIDTGVCNTAMRIMTSIHCILQAVLFYAFFTSYTGGREIGSDCALNGEMKGFVESSENSHTVEGWQNIIFSCSYFYVL